MQIFARDDQKINNILRNGDLDRVDFDAGDSGGWKVNVEFDEVGVKDREGEFSEASVLLGLENDVEVVGDGIFGDDGGAEFGYILW